MDATFVIGFHTQRFDNLLQTLRFLHKNHSEFIRECQLVTVCQDEVTMNNLQKSCFDTLESSMDIPAQQAIGEFNYWCRYFDRWDHFDMNVGCMQLPVISNFGVGKAVADKVFLLESDRILPVGYFEEVSKQLISGFQITTQNMRKILTPTLDTDITDEKYEYKNEHRNKNATIGMRSMWSGNTAFMKCDFYYAGQMDEKYKGYGWADNDMTLTMENVGIQSIFRDELELHLWHPSATYDGEKDSKLLFVENGVRFCEKWNKPIPDWLQEDIDKIQKRHLI